MTKLLCFIELNLQYQYSSELTFIKHTSEIQYIHLLFHSFIHSLTTASIYQHTHIPIHQFSSTHL
jgi:hypothetical protein